MPKMGKSSLVIYNGASTDQKFEIEKNAYWGSADFAEISCQLTTCLDKDELIKQLETQQIWTFSLKPGQRTPSHDLINSFVGDLEIKAGTASETVKISGNAINNFVFAKNKIFYEGEQKKSSSGKDSS